MFILIHNENILFIQSILYSIKLIICVHFAWQKHIITKSLSVILNCGEFLFAFLAQNCLNFLLFLLTYNRCVETKHKFVFTSIQLTINWLNIIDINVKSSADSANRIDNANGGKRLNFEPLNYQGDMGKNRGWALHVHCPNPQWPDSVWTQRHMSGTACQHTLSPTQFFVAKNANIRNKLCVRVSSALLK